MKHKKLYINTMRALGVVMLLYGLIMMPALSSIVDELGWSIYGAVWTLINVAYLASGVYLIINRRKSLVVCITLVLVIQAVSSVINYVVALHSDGDLAFARAVISTMLVLIDIVLLVLYLMGFRRSSRRLMMLLGLQTYIAFLELAISIHLSREFVDTLFLNIQTLFSLILYALLIVLICNRSVSDLPIKRMSRYNSERLFTSLGCGTIIAISEDSYATIVSDDRSSWPRSADPEVESEIVIPAKDRYGKYELLVQKRRGHDSLRIVFHDAFAIGYLNTVTVDVSYISDLGRAYGCRKVRFYGKEGMFIDLLVGEPNMRLYEDTNDDGACDAPVPEQE